MANRTLSALIRESAERYRDWTFMMERRETGYQGATFGEIEDEAERVANFFLSKGINNRDRIAILAEGRNSWVAAECGILLSGAISVPISVKIKTEEELLFRFKHSESKIIITSERQLNKVIPLLKKLPELKILISMDNLKNKEKSNLPDNIEAYSWEETLKIGDQYRQQNPEKLKEREKSIAEDDPATLTYTSGTTAEPKGILLSHKNYWVNVDDVNVVFKLPIPFYTLLILPWDHSFAHTAGIYSFMKKGSVIAAVEPGKTEIGTIRNIPKNIREIKPTYLLVVPALVESFRRSIETKIQDKGGLSEKLFNLTVKLGTRLNGNYYKKRFDPVSLLLWPIYLPLKSIISKQVKAGLGGRIEFMVGGGSAVSIDTVKWFTAIGLPVYQGYGLSETSPIVSSNTNERGCFKIGSSGKPFPWAEIRIVDENDNPLPTGNVGEVTVKGESVMLEYWKNEEATREAIRNGYFHTGDLGYIDEDGFLFIVGRIKSLLVGQDGEKYSPETLEQHMEINVPFVYQIMLYNQQNPYTIALIVPDKEKMLKWIEGNNLDPNSTTTAETVLQELNNAIKRYKEDKTLSEKFIPQWTPKTFAVLPEPFSEENGMINSTLKMVRRKIAKAYEDRIAKLFSEEANPINPTNIKTIKEWLQRE